jgi:sulfotransferase
MSKFAFLSGLPRSGSTLLGTLLSQHPSVYVSPTSSVREMINYILKYRLGDTPYFDLNDMNSPGWGAARGLLYGHYANIEKPLVVEKSRGWASDVGTAGNLIASSPKIVASVRPIPEVISSFILVSERMTTTSQIELELEYVNREKNPWTLSRMVWEKYVYAGWRSLKTGFENHPENFHLLEYRELVDNPQETLDKVFEYLDVDPHPILTSGLVNLSPEDDSKFGLTGLHTLRSEVKRTSPPAQEVLGEECYSFWVKKNLDFWRKG